jgi:predicted RNA binding protein YcfA (HicA-like mRNA interferase family)
VRSFLSISNTYFLNDSDFTIFEKPNIYFFELKSYKVSEVIKMLKDDDWYLVAQKGSHRQFKHSVRNGKVTINGKPGDTLSQFLLNNIFKHAGWK